MERSEFGLMEKLVATPASLPMFLTSPSSSSSTSPSSPSSSSCSPILLTSTATLLFLRFALRFVVRCSKDWLGALIDCGLIDGAAIEGNLLARPLFSTPISFNNAFRLTALFIDALFIDALFIGALFIRTLFTDALDPDNPASIATGAALTMALCTACGVLAISDNFVPSGPTRRTLGYPSTFNCGAFELILLLTV